MTILCLRCNKVIPGMAVWLFVDGKPLPVGTKDTHVFCLECGGNGKNGITSAEYEALTR